eukprot:NODE_5507_length_572_cov_41.986616_g4784_i0.p2 GENE.NODE_5507_length_572_cov_41.986616_g4784_i0~~NODE_5507_length_572_cov_41.986616_g4784_i0.p2  ORF type:complete len:143 (+),score=28.90 NODE_5507_length_572_cov_41.986616_g4784_i0:33-461(+)
MGEVREAPHAEPSDSTSDVRVHTPVVQPILSYVPSPSTSKLSSQHKLPTPNPVAHATSTEYTPPSSPSALRPMSPTGRSTPCTPKMYRHQSPVRAPVSPRGGCHSSSAGSSGPTYRRRPSPTPTSPSHLPASRAPQQRRWYP